MTLREPEHIDLSTPSDTETDRLARTGNARGAPVNRSNPVTLEGGAVGGGTLTVDVPEFTRKL